MPITQVPQYVGEIPVIGQNQPTFNQNTADMFNYIGEIANGINTTAGEIDTASASVDQNRVLAEDAANSAVSVVNFAGDFTAGVTSAIAGNSYKYEDGYWACLSNTTETPAYDNANWEKKVSQDDLNAAEERSQGAGVRIYRGTGTTNGQRHVQNGDVVPDVTPPYTHLAVVINGKVEDVAMSPVASGAVSLLTETSATIGGSVVTLASRPYQQLVTPENYGAASGADSTEAVVRWLKSGKPLTLDKEYLITSIDESIGGIRYYSTSSEGKLTSSTSNLGKPVVKITGGNNKFYGDFNVFHTGDMRNFSEIIKLVGNHNRIESSTASCLIDYDPVDGEQFGRAGILVDGDSNSVVSCHSENTGTAVHEAGRNNWIVGNTSFNVCRAVLNSEKSRGAQVLGNVGDGGSKGLGLSGCDGILGYRSHRGTVYSGNTMSNFGEHGYYLQGDTFVFHADNKAKTNHSCALKVGAKPDGNFEYAGETLKKFDRLGALDLMGGQYATWGAKVLGIIAEDNGSIGMTDGVVTLQPNIAEIEISCDIVGAISEYAFKSTFFSGLTTDDTVLCNLDIGRISATGGDIVLSASSGLKVTEINAPSSTIQTFSRGGSSGLPVEQNLAPKIRGLKVDKIIADRVFGGEFSGECNDFRDGSGQNIRLVDLEIKDTNDSSFTSRIDEIKDCDITKLGSSASISIESRIVESTEFNLPDATGVVAVKYSFNSPNPNRGNFDSNIINAPNANRLLSIGGSISSVCNNIINSAPTSDYAIVSDGDGCVISDNVLAYGAVSLTNVSSNNEVRQRRVDADGSGHMIYGETIKLLPNSQNCFAVGKAVTDQGTSGSNSKITP